MKADWRYALCATIVLCLPLGMTASAANRDRQPDTSNWMNQAVTLERKADWPHLAELGQQWTRDEPGNATAWFVYGRALGALHYYPEAMAAYRKVLAIDPRDAYARNNLGDALKNSNRFLDAMHTYRDTVDIHPDYVLAWQNLGMTFFQLKGMAGVSQALQKLHTTDPELADAWHALAITYAQTHDERIAQQAVGVLRGLSRARKDHMFEVLFSAL